jgi:hypothetical protein
LAGAVPGRPAAAILVALISVDFAMFFAALVFCLGFLPIFFMTAKDNTKELSVWRRAELGSSGAFISLPHAQLRRVGMQ